MGRIRKEHSNSFKVKVALEAIKGEQPMAELAKEYKIHPMQISKWKRIVLDRLPEVFSKGTTSREREHAELIDALYREIGELKVRLDWLKKKSGYVD